MDYTESTRVKEMAESLIEQHHPHLSKAKIAYLMKGGEVGRKRTERRKGKRTQVCRVSKADDKWEFLSGYHFVIEVSQPIWDNIESPDAQNALLDDALCRMGKDNKGYYTNDPTIVVFLETVERHGLWNEDLREFGQLQMDLFDPSKQPDKEPELAEAS